jgi:phosphatidylethanolamine/phosphatidyl-N-methylethanolamine N-methyltransferase
MTTSNLLLFLRSFALDPRSVGAIAPSGSNLASLITSEIDPAEGPVLELGPGTGVFTEAILRRGVRESDLTLIEYGSDFMRLLQRRFPRARVLWMDAAWLVTHRLFEGRRFGVAISGIPLLNLPSRKVIAILEGVFANVREGGALYQFTYGMQCPVARAELDELGLQARRIGRVYLNVPPASVYKITQRQPCEREP